MPLSYSFELVGQVVSWLKEDNYTPELVSKIGQDGNLKKFRDVLEGKAEIVMKKVEEAVTTLLCFLQNIATPAVAGKKTSKCFTDKSRYYYRDSDLDGWLRKDQPAQPESVFAVQKLAEPATFKKIAETFLGIIGDIKTIARELKSRGHVTTLAVIESLIERQENGEDVGLLTNGYGNFFFVADGNESVSVVRVGRDDGRWHAGVRRLGSDDRWDAGDRFFFRNSDTESL